MYVIEQTNAKDYNSLFYDLNRSTKQQNKINPNYK